MPQLTWIGKDKVENHDKDLPFRVLKPNKNLSFGEDDNLLIQGDNLEALKALMPFYHGKIKFIYIDPPYNTGNEKWVYNDKVNSPQIRAWLNKVVGPEGEDLCRHDKWLCMIYPRLKLLSQLLSDDGVICVSINDIEQANLKLLMNEIFGETNFITTLIWKSRQNKDNRSVNGVSIDHEYIHCYCKNNNRNKFFKGDERKVDQYKNPDNDSRGLWVSSNMVGILPEDQRPNCHYDLINPDTGVNYGKPNLGWRYDKNTMNRLIKEDRILWPSNADGRPRRKVFLNELKSETTGFSSVIGEHVFTRQGSGEIFNIFQKRVFDFPKPPSLIKILINQICGDNDIVLDSFAGTGTTGQAVLELNKTEDATRKFILVEIDSEIAKTITVPRLKAVINGYENALYPEGTGQGFQYLDLNGELFNKSGFVNQVVNYEDLASYIYFTETKSYLDLKTIDKPFIGSYGSNNYILLFEGKGENVLDEKVLKQLSKYSGKKVIFADKTLLDDDYCEKHNIVFKQIPYELKKY
jgi:adenine specific DNA methylase Mod